MGVLSKLFKPKQERVLIVDVGSATVTAAFVVLEEKKPALVEATVSADITVLSDLTLARFEKEMEKAMRQALAGLHALRMSPPDRIAVFLASPWYASQVRIAKMSRPAQFVISKTLMNDMISREIKAFEEEEITAKKGSSDAVRAIESKTVQVMLNGYPAHEPIGRSVRELEISLFLSIAPEKMLKNIEEIISHEYPHRPVSFSSFLGASFVVTRDYFPHEKQYMLIDVGGEVTDVSLIKDGSPVQSVSFPRGRNFILRRLSAGLKRSITEAVSICTLYVEGKVEDSIKDSCTRILTEAKNEWLSAFQSSLFSVSNELSLPDTVLLTCHGDVAPWFVETIRREEFHQYTLTEREFNVILLDAELFHEALVFGNGVPRHPFIMIEALSCLRQPIAVSKIPRV